MSTDAQLQEIGRQRAVELITVDPAAAQEMMEESFKQQVVLEEHLELAVGKLAELADETECVWNALPEAADEELATYAHSAMAAAAHWHEVVRTRAANIPVRMPGLDQRVQRAIALLRWVRGMCSDEMRHSEIDAQVAKAIEWLKGT